MFEWVSVKSWLPEPSETVYECLYDGRVFRCVRDYIHPASDVSVWVLDGFVFHGVTHWRESCEQPANAAEYELPASVIAAAANVSEPTTESQPASAATVETGTESSGRT